MLAALAAGAVAGTTFGAGIRSRRPAATAGRLFLAQAAALVLIPVAGLAGAAVAAVAFGLANPVGELIIVTALRSFPTAVLERIMGLVMLASADAFPISVAVTTAVVHSVGAAAVFPLAGPLPRRLSFSASRGRANGRRESNPHDQLGRCMACRRHGR